MVRADNLEPINVYIAGTRLPANLRWCHLVRGTWNPGILQLSRFFFENWPVKCTYYTTHYTLNVSRIRQFIENEECFREFYHGGCTRNSIPRTTTVTVFFLNFVVKSHIFFVGSPGYISQLPSQKL